MSEEENKLFVMRHYDKADMRPHGDKRDKPKNWPS